ncbi:MAG: GrpB family protein [Pyrinomonadaceae bacterium]|nr:GrpB family protein [Pyrinomonadaceae bacterium]
MLGLEKKTVTLHSHTEEWHELFAQEKVRLQKAVGEFVESIEHIGSTSVCGIAAKPILDIAATINDQANGEKCIAPLENLGYEYRGEYGIAGRFYFVKGAPRTHHLHILAANSKEWRNHLFLRDYLRQNSEAAAKYDKLKKDLAEKHRSDRDVYLAEKAEFIKEILEKSIKKYE